MRTIRMKHFADGHTEEIIEETPESPGPPAPDPVSPGPWKLVWVSPEESEFEGVGHWDVYREEAALRETGPNQFQADLRDVRAVNVACLVGCSEADARYIVALRNQAGAAVPAPRDAALSTVQELWNGDMELTAEQRAWIRQALDAQEPVSPGAPPAARLAPTPKIYIASRTRHGARWRALRDNTCLPIISTWIDECEPGQTADYGDLMRRCIEEASRATAFICYAEGDDIAGWKGVWFEMGAACAAGVPVFFVGTHDFPSALRHPNVTFCADFDAALRAALAAAREP